MKSGTDVQSCYNSIDAKYLILDNLTTEVEKRYWEVYENCYGNESESESE